MLKSNVHKNSEYNIGNVYTDVKFSFAILGNN